MDNDLSLGFRQIENLLCGYWYDSALLNFLLPMSEDAPLLRVLKNWKSLLWLLRLHCAPLRLLPVFEKLHCPPLLLLPLSEHWPPLVDSLVHNRSAQVHIWLFQGWQEVMREKVAEGDGYWNLEENWLEGREFFFIFLLSKLTVFGQLSELWGEIVYLAQRSSVFLSMSVSQIPSLLH